MSGTVKVLLNQTGYFPSYEPGTTSHRCSSSR